VTLSPRWLAEQPLTRITPGRVRKSASASGGSNHCQWPASATDSEPESQSWSRCGGSPGAASGPSCYSHGGPAAPAHGPLAPCDPLAAAPGPSAAAAAAAAGGPGGPGGGGGRTVVTVPPDRRRSRWASGPPADRRGGPGRPRRRAAAAADSDATAKSEPGPGKWAEFLPLKVEIRTLFQTQ
jgi:hypothetical protein